MKDSSSESSERGENAEIESERDGSSSSFLTTFEGEVSIRVVESGRSIGGGLREAERRTGEREEEEVKEVDSIR